MLLSGSRTRGIVLFGWRLTSVCKSAGVKECAFNPVLDLAIIVGGGRSTTSLIFYRIIFILLSIFGTIFLPSLSGTSVHTTVVLI